MDRQRLSQWNRLEEADEESAFEQETDSDRLELTLDLSDVAFELCQAGGRAEPSTAEELREERALWVEPMLLVAER